MSVIVPGIAPIGSQSFTNMTLTFVSNETLFGDDQTFAGHTLAIATDNIYLLFGVRIRIWYEYSYDAELQNLQTLLVTPFLNWVNVNVSSGWTYNNTPVYYTNPAKLLVPPQVCVFPLFDVGTKQMYVVYSDSYLSPINL